MTNETWAFGWTQVFTAIGLAMTGYFGWSGLRTFDKWKREKLEERKIETALDALAVAYHSKWIFEHIRAPLVLSGEYADMPKWTGESDNHWQARGSLYAISRRVRHHKEFFDSIWKLQTRCMAVVGPHAEEVFIKIHEARRDIEVAVELLMWHLDQNDPDEKDSEDTEANKKQLRADITTGIGKFAKEGDRVGKKVEEFRSGIEALCRPIVDRTYKANRPSTNAA
jgi:hypothetical protein